jgi:uncharacterized iron-regulated protein
LHSLAGGKPAYIIFDKSGKEVSYEEVLKQSTKADVVFFGELHNNAISHWLQYELTKDLIDKKDKKVVLGAEMFESDNQLIMDEYLSGLIKENKFESECRLWPNYKTDYKPLMILAKENQLRFIATNIPRRYASLVFSKGLEGLETLTPEAKSYVADLPVHYDPEQDAYKSMMQMGGNGMPGHVTNNLPKAQAVKDATMAKFIHENIKKKHVFIHYNGAYHSDKYQGIIYYFERLSKKYDILTISTVTSDDLNSISDEDKNKADYIIVVDENMTSTH